MVGAEAQALREILLMQGHESQRWAGVGVGAGTGGRGRGRGRKSSFPREELEEIDSETSGSSDEEIEED